MRLKHILLCALAVGFALAAQSQTVAQAQDLKPVRDKQTKKYGYQAKRGNMWVIEPVFDGAKRFVDGYAEVEVDGLKGLIDANGDWVLPAEFDDINKFDKNGLCEVMRKEGRTKWRGVADRSGRMILPVDCRSVNIPRNGGYITAERAGKVEGFPEAFLWGVYDMQGREVLAPQFVSSPSFSGGTFIGKSARTGLTGVVNEDGEELLPFEYLTVTRSGGGFRTLSTDFTRTLYSADLSSAERSRYPGAIAPYDPMGDPVRAAAWHSGCIGVRMHRNNVKLIEMQPGRVGRSAYCRDLSLDWGRDRFLRLEPFEDAERHEGCMLDPASGKYYTLKALLYEADGTLVGEASSWGWLDAECAAGVVYNAEGEQSWLLLEDLNCLAVPSFSLSLTGYRSIDHDDIYSGLGLEERDVERCTDPDSYADRLEDIIEGDNIGLTSYMPRPIDLRHARSLRDMMRAPLFRYPYRMGEVVSCAVRQRDEDVEVQLYEQLVCRFEDRLEDPYYSMHGEEMIYWGPNNARSVRVSLEATRSSDALADDVYGTDAHYYIVLSLYEEDGSWLRTLAEAPFADYAQDGVLVFERLGIALLAPDADRLRRDDFDRGGYRRDARGAVERTVKLPGAQRLPHTLSALEEGAKGFPERRFSGRRQWDWD